MVGIRRESGEPAEGRGAPETLPGALFGGPGPRTPGQALLLFAKGFCMGAADIIPGVSGGTIAFITGIYEDLLSAIRSVNLRFVASLARFDLKSALAGVHLRFLLPLMAGLLTAVVGASRIMHHLLTNYPVEIWSLFMGLIAASIWVVGRKVDRWGPAAAIMLIFGTVASYLIVGMIPVQTPEELWFIFLCGVIAICAMILPGVSGAFLLLLLGKYEYVTGALKAPFEAHNLLVLAVFAAGCAVGITGFSRLLSALLRRWHGPAVAVLTGFMIGGMRKVWPWKEVLETRVVHGKEYVLREMNVLPQALGPELYAPILLMLAGLALVLLLEYVSTGKERRD